jgi:hypothetical protein
MLAEILINARKESYRMQHFYIGVEHVFIGMLEIPTSFTARHILAHGFATHYVIDMIRRHTGKGAPNPQFAGMPHTPRLNMVLSIAHDLAAESLRETVTERDLLAAILEEDDNIPVRVMRRIGLDLGGLHDALAHDEEDSAPVPALVTLELGPGVGEDFALPAEYAHLLRVMFRDYDRVRIERRLRGGYTGAWLLLITPLAADGTADALVVVKIDEAARIAEEAQRYTAHVKNTLPPLTARLEEQPTAVHGSLYAGLKYTFVSGGSEATDLRAAVQAGLIGLEALAWWLQHALYTTFAPTWWGQKRSFRFPAWVEYDGLLPPLLILDYVAQAPAAEAVSGDNDESGPIALAPAFVVREPVRRDRIAALHYGDVVRVENFAVRRVYRERDAIMLAFGKGSEGERRAYRIEVRNMRLSDNAHYPRETVEHITGTVYETRAGLLMAALRLLDPPFDPTGPVMPGVGEIASLPNPILHLDTVLDQFITGAYSRIHGDLNLGNILLGPNNAPFLIDFAEARTGHTVFDWVCLEISLLADVVLPALGGESWDDAARALAGLVRVHNPAFDREPWPDEAASRAFAPVRAVLGVVRECLAMQNGWNEYYLSLAICAVRAMMWETLSLGGRRLMIGTAGWAIARLFAQRTHGSGSATAVDTDQTDWT